VHIDRVAISHFRNFRSLVIEDLPTGVVIVGENSSGKSNFLQALRLVLDPSVSETRRRLTSIIRPTSGATTPTWSIAVENADGPVRARWT
jgi:predicted ATP-dependent endonuclease of OLD family